MDTWDDANHDGRFNSASCFRASARKPESVFGQMLYVRDPAGKLANILAHSPAEDG
jgi:hypothetical protein